MTATSTYNDDYVAAADEVEELDDVLELVTGAAEGGAAEGCWAAGTAAGLTGS